MKYLFLILFSIRVFFAAAQADSIPAAVAPHLEGDTIPVAMADSAVLSSGRVSLSPKATPVDIDREKPAAPPLHYYDKHGNPLDTPVRFLATLDTVTSVKAGPKYPLYNGVSISANFFDAIMMAAGQKRANFDVAASVSLWNWLFPVIETGVGFSNSHPDDGRTFYKMGPSWYIRAGVNYNFLYKSDPAYRLYVGIRAAFSPFGYDLPVISPGSQYYTQDGPSAMWGLHGNCWYGQVLLGLEVKIWRIIYMGWSARYSFNIKNSYSDPDYPAWYIPGRNAASPLSATFSIGVTI